MVVPTDHGKLMCIRGKSADRGAIDFSGSITSIHFRNFALSSSFHELVCRLNCYDEDSKMFSNLVGVFELMSL